MDFYLIAVADLWKRWKYDHHLGDETVACTMAGYHDSSPSMSEHGHCQVDRENRVPLYRESTFFESVTWKPLKIGR